MTTSNPASGTDTGVPGGALERLALFAEWTGTTPPERITDGTGEDATLTRDMLSYARRNGLDLDWLILGDERGIVMSRHRAALMSHHELQDAMNTTDPHISRACGIAHVLHTVASEFPGLCNPDPHASGILVLIGLLLEEVHATQKVHEAEWSAIRGAMKEAAA